MGLPGQLTSLVVTHPWRASSQAPLRRAPSSTTEQPYRVGELVPLGVAMVTIPGVVPLGLKLVSRLAVPEPLAGCS
jgi:hypothetical protein